MGAYVGLDVSLKRTEICVIDGDGRVLWRGVADTHPEMIAVKLDRWREKIVRIGLETGSTTPWLACGLRALGFPVVVRDARRRVGALKARPVKTDRADARALAVFVKSEESHRIEALLLSRDQLVKMKRQIYGQIRGVLRRPAPPDLPPGPSDPPKPGVTDMAESGLCRTSVGSPPALLCAIAVSVTAPRSAPRPLAGTCGWTY